MLTNLRRKKRIQEFMDKNHAVMGEYYDVLEEAKTDAELKRAMGRFIEKDPDFFDPYLTLSELEMVQGNAEQGIELLREAFERAIKRIADADGNWPEHMEWGWLENRHLMRALERWAIVLWEQGETDEALDIFRRLFRANPGDNQGARHFILALRMGLGTDWYLPFEVKDGPMAGQAIDVGKSEDWFEENMKKFPEEFDWWQVALKELGYID